VSGILDNKSRVMDVIITAEGRRQLADAKMKVEYVTFTDTGTYYRADIASGSADASTRIHFEGSHLPQDQITFEADDSGRLKPFGNDDGIVVKDGQIVSYSFDSITTMTITGSSQNMKILRGDEFASTAGTLLASSLSNFTKLQVIGTRDKIFEDDGFGVGNKTLEFVVTDKKPISDPARHVVEVDQLESLFNDVRLSKIRNFKFLPPLNKVNDSAVDKRNHRLTTRNRLGNYKPWGRTHDAGLAPKQLESELARYENSGYARTVTFDPTSRENHLVGQFFEVSNNTMKKLDVIDYGRYVWKGAPRQCFFVGKVMVDGNGSQTFIHLFTMIFG